MNKNFLIKILLSIIISISLIPLVNAAEEQVSFSDVFDDIADKPCITAEEEKSDKIIQFIEEPLGDAQPPSEEFEIRNCFRNTFQYLEQIPQPVKEGETPKIIKKPRIIAYLAKECSSSAQGKVENHKNAPHNARFTCRQIQAILSDTGTTFLYGYIAMFYRWVASLVGIIAVSIIVLSGIQISASGGDPDSTSKAKNRIIQSLVGIAVLLLSGLILNTINPNFFVN